MPFTVGLEYTLLCPQEGLPSTESSFVRRSVPFKFEVGDIGLALVDVWNFGFEGGPVGETLGSDLSFERGRSHALRKRRIVEEVIAPTVDRLRAQGVQVFHCSHARFLDQFPQWTASTTETEREAAKPKPVPEQKAPNMVEQGAETLGDTAAQEPWPPREWVSGWREQHLELVWRQKSWGMVQGREVYPQIALAPPVQPKAGDLLVSSQEQFHRLLTERRIRALFYMGFETDQCLMYSGYGLANMQNDYCGCNYLCTVVRDGTTTYEVAETLEGQWRTRAAVIDIESRFGYSVTSSALMEAVASAGAVVGANAAHDGSGGYS